jgi:hypothetical protein
VIGRESDEAQLLDTRTQLFGPGKFMVRRVPVKKVNSLRINCKYFPLQNSAQCPLSLSLSLLQSKLETDRPGRMVLRRGSFCPYGVRFAFPNSLMFVAGQICRVCSGCDVLIKAGRVRSDAILLIGFLL